MSDVYNNNLRREQLGGNSYNSSNPYFNQNNYASNNPYQDNNPHSSNDPYKESHNPHSNSNQAVNIKEEKKYPFCNTYFLLQDKFRAFFNADVDLHEEKRDYIGDGEKINLQTLMYKHIFKAFFLTFFLVTISYFIFLLGTIYFQIIASLILILTYIAFMYCPAYITYSTRQYVIGDRTYDLYKHWLSGFKLKVQVLIGSGLTNITSIIFLANYKDYLVSNIHQPILKKIFTYMTNNFIYNTILFNLLYALIIGVYFIFTYKIQKKSEILREKNYKEAKWVKTKNTFQQKQAKLSGDW
jgi:hypothetical protein